MTSLAEFMHSQCRQPGCTRKPYAVLDDHGEVCKQCHSHLAQNHIIRDWHAKASRVQHQRGEQEDYEAARDARSRQDHGHWNYGQ